MSDKKMGAGYYTNRQPRQEAVLGAALAPSRCPAAVRPVPAWALLWHPRRGLGSRPSSPHWWGSKTHGKGVTLPPAVVRMTFLLRRMAILC